MRPPPSLYRSLCLPPPPPPTSRLRPPIILPPPHRLPGTHPSRHLTTSPPWRSHPPQTTSRGPPSTETTQTDFGTMDVLGNTPPPTTAIDACLSDGFHLDNGVKIGGGSGCLLVGGEAFGWRPWEAMGDGGGGMVNQKGQWDVGDGAWGVLEVVWPRPGA